MTNEKRKSPLQVELSDSMSLAMDRWVEATKFSKATTVRMALMEYFSTRIPELAPMMAREQLPAPVVIRELSGYQPWNLEAELEMIWPPIQRANGGDHAANLLAFESAVLKLKDKFEALGLPATSGRAILLMMLYGTDDAKKYAEYLAYPPTRRREQMPEILKNP